jgi:hypothetical protein
MVPTGPLRVLQAMPWWRPGQHLSVPLWGPIHLETEQTEHTEQSWSGPYAGLGARRPVYPSDLHCSVCSVCSVSKQRGFT